MSMINNIKYKITLKIIAENLTYLLLFLMLFVPYEYQYVKVTLLILIMLLVTVKAVASDKVQIDTRILCWFMILICTGAFYVLWGTVNGHMGSIKVFPLYVIWPIFYIFIVGAIDGVVAINKVFKVIVFSSLFISLYSIYFTLEMLNIVPSIGITTIVQSAKPSFANDLFSYYMPSITSMIYIIPFIFSSLLLWTKADVMPINPVFLYLIFVISIISVISTSRRMIWLLIVLTPIFTLLFTLFLSKKYRIKRNIIYLANIKKIGLILLIFLALVVCFYGRELFDMAESLVNTSVFVDAVTFQDDGTAVRTEQLKYLLDGWSDVPLLGAGHGAALPTYQRSFEAPWSYEFSYVAFLYQTGLLGLVIYLLEILWIYYAGIKLYRNNETYSLYIIPTLVAMTCFLLATATNPYIYAFDHLWTIFISIILVNVFSQSNLRYGSHVPPAKPGA